MTRKSGLVRVLALATLVAAPLPATAQNLSAEIAATGLAPVIARLEGISAPTPSENFALGGLRFLRTIEFGMQQRWAMGLNDPLGLPLLRIPLSYNPAPASFDPAVIAMIFRDTANGMTSARAALDSLAEGAEPVVELDLAAVWLDVNVNATRDPGEGLLDLVGGMIQTDSPPAPNSLTVRFDAADAAWLSAYTHLLEGLGDLVLAYDPTAAVRLVTDSRQRMIPGADAGAQDYLARDYGIFFDVGYAVIEALDQPPDASRSRAALDHFRAMVADNRRFWALVAAETDNDREWLPNDAQQSAFGITLPRGTGTVWLAVLDDLDRLLTGDLLMPHWRFAREGVNVARMLSEPAPIDLAGWIQGSAAIPYLEKGLMISSASWGAFEQMLDGRGMLMAVYLN